MQHGWNETTACECLQRCKHSQNYKHCIKYSLWARQGLLVNCLYNNLVTCARNLAVQRLLRTSGRRKREKKERKREWKQHPFLAPTLLSTNPVLWRGRESPCHRRLTQIWHADFPCTFSLEHEGCFGFIISGKHRKSWMFQEGPMFYWKGGTMESQFRGHWAFGASSPAHLLFVPFFSHKHRPWFWVAQSVIQ